MMVRTLRVMAGALPVVMWAAPALAYVGPGAGITLVGALWGVVIAIAAAVGFVLLWPLRRAFVSRNRRTGDDGKGQGAGHPTTARPEQR